MYGATLTAVTINGDCAVTPTYDVWYRFTAQTTNPTIKLSNIGVDFTNPAMELLSGGCGGHLTAIQCGTTSIAANYLTPGTIYYIRVYSTSGTVPITAYAGDVLISVSLILWLLRPLMMIVQMPLIYRSGITVIMLPET